MTSRKKSKEQPAPVPQPQPVAEPPNFAALLPSGKNIVVAAGCLGVLAYAGSEAWRHYGAAHFRTDAYAVPAASLLISSPPPWVRGDVKHDVIRTASLDHLSLLDRDVTRRVAQAFAIHPWVAEVKSVRKAYPSQLEVTLEYRRPAAMVEVMQDGKPGLLPVSNDGVLLPPEDFSIGMAKAFPRIAVENAFPSGAVGTPWGDPRITASARLADFIGQLWKDAPLHRIAAQPRIVGGSTENPSLEITSREGRRFIWGSAPGSELPGEPGADVKRERLIARLRNSAGAGDTIDLRLGEGI